jgi:hypothetical protein
MLPKRDNVRVNVFAKKHDRFSWPGGFPDPPRVQANAAVGVKKRAGGSNPQPPGKSDTGIASDNGHKVRPKNGPRLKFASLN